MKEIQTNSLITKISLLLSLHLKMSAVQWEDALYLDWIHGLKGNSKLFKLVPFFKSSSLVVLEKDFFHKRKFSILILQLVVLWCPHKDAAYIEEREITAAPPPPELLLFCLKRWNYFGEVELFWRSWAPWRRGASCAYCWAHCQRDSVPRPVCAHGWHEQLLSHFKLKCWLWAGANHSFQQLWKKVGVEGMGI